MRKYSNYYEMGTLHSKKLRKCPFYEEKSSEESTPRCNLKYSNFWQILMSLHQKLTALFCILSRGILFSFAFKICCQHIFARFYNNGPIYPPACKRSEVTLSESIYKYNDAEASATL